MEGRGSNAYPPWGVRGGHQTERTWGERGVERGLQTWAGRVELRHRWGSRVTAGYCWELEETPGCSAEGGGSSHNREDPLSPPPPSRRRDDRRGVYLSLSVPSSFWRLVCGSLRRCRLHLSAENLTKRSSSWLSMSHFHFKFDEARLNQRMSFVFPGLSTSIRMFHLHLSWSFSDKL